MKKKNIIIGALLIIGITAIVIHNMKPPIETYITVYADKGDNLTKIIKEEYSTQTLDDVGINYIIEKSYEEEPDGILKIGEKVYLPVFKK